MHRIENKYTNECKTATMIQPNGTHLLVQMITRDFFQLILVNHLDGYLFTSEHMPSHLDDSKMAFSERLLQIIHTGDVATIMFGGSDRVRFADHPAAVLHRLQDLQTHPDKHRSIQTGLLTFQTETIADYYEVHRRPATDSSGVAPLTSDGVLSSRFHLTFSVPNGKYQFVETIIFAPKKRTATITTVLFFSVYYYYKNI